VSSSLAMPTADLPHRVAFVLLLVGWLLIRAIYTRRHVVTHQNAVENATDHIDRLLTLATGIFLLVPASYWLSFGASTPSALPFPDSVRIAGGLVALSALTLFLQTHRALGDNWSIGLEVRREHGLVDTGPYRLVRHPMYLAIGLFELGLGLLAADLLVLIVSPLPFWLLVLRRLPREEALMERYFGDAYRRYASRTKRVVPWIC
jgi:protein-S-isoprenylcysteine O-methyltransferase Ste14